MAQVLFNEAKLVLMHELLVIYIANAGVVVNPLRYSLMFFERRVNGLRTGDHQSLRFSLQQLLYAWTDYLHHDRKFALRPPDVLVELFEDLKILIDNDSINWREFDEVSMSQDHFRHCMVVELV